eukprot:3529153-Pyramimonas_sp.AAC.1
MANSLLADLTGVDPSLAGFLSCGKLISRDMAGVPRYGWGSPAGAVELPAGEAVDGAGGRGRH